MINYQQDYCDKDCQNCCGNTLQNLTKLQNNYRLYNNTATIIEKKKKATSKTCKNNLRTEFDYKLVYSPVLQTSYMAK